MKEASSGHLEPFRLQPPKGRISDVLGPPDFFPLIPVSCSHLDPPSIPVEVGVVLEFHANALDGPGHNGYYRYTAYRAYDSYPLMSCLAASLYLFRVAPRTHSLLKLSIMASSTLPLTWVSPSTTSMTLQLHFSITASIKGLYPRALAAMHRCRTQSTLESCER